MLDYTVMHRVIVGITGASCMPVVKTLVATLAPLEDVELYGIISTEAATVWANECSGNIEDMLNQIPVLWPIDDFAAPAASGSWWRPALTTSMVIVPCSMSTIGALAAGYTANLIHRIGQVALKEGRKLLLIPRETPLSAIHLQNMLTLRTAGATIMPFSPSFYLNPDSIQGMLAQFTSRILDQLGILHPALRWEGDPPF